MIRRSVRGLLLTLLVFASAACGEAFDPPAAVVGGEPISMQTLQHELDLLLLQPQFEEQVGGAGGDAARKDLTRQLLAYLIQGEVLRDYARRAGISVAPGEVEARLAEEVERLGGQAAFETELEAQGLTVEIVRQNLEIGLLSDKVRDSVLDERGISLADQPEEADAALREWYQGRLDALDVEVNPRFGRLDPGTGQINAATSTAA